MSDRWRVAGVYFQGCNCPSPCPCGSNCPSHQCDVAVGWHISQGGTSQVNLGGLNVIRVARTADAANSVLHNELFIDARADDRQRQALAEIFSGDRGGQPAALRAVAGEVQSVQYVPIDGTDCRLRASCTLTWMPNPYRPLIRLSATRPMPSATSRDTGHLPAPP